ncbi:MAG: FAD-dependent oxidoreductase [Flavobacteriales bacterium]|nr:FAD-dependent oxidoreductase [Flavobacteriales bacterium]
MSSNFDILFEPVQIGPVTAPNRFYQVPHCNGLGYRMPKALAAMRGIKAEGGWGVVCTEEIEIHHTSELAPLIEGRLWDDGDKPGLQMMADAVHEHGSLAGIEIAYYGLDACNLYSRVPVLSARSQGVNGGYGFEPSQSHRMDKQDIKNVRKWHRDAAIRAKDMGFDIIYVYAAHNMSIATNFLSKRYNDRTDEYGGNFENRSRLLRELIMDTKDAVGDKCAVAVRFAVDELLGGEGITSQQEGRDIIESMAELPDLWDVNVAGWENDSSTSRFEKEGFQEEYTSFVKSITTKPVVGVGRYTSPESMVAAVKGGVLDLIGAARPSIADPFLPNKIKEGRIEDIRECIGCNICVVGDTNRIPIRCTQNPTMGEEFRYDWHPEKINVKTTDNNILVVGAGPTGLECARALGQRGYNVILAEASMQLGGRVELESKLPGLSEWIRVVDYRVTQIDKMDNVEVYKGSKMTAEDVMEVGYENVIIATGASWRKDGQGRYQYETMPGTEMKHVYTPDDIMAGKIPKGKVIIYDNDLYYMGGCIAEKLKLEGCDVSIVTPDPRVSAWMEFTLEQEKVQKQLMKMGVQLHTEKYLERIESDHVIISDKTSGEETKLECDAVVMVTDRSPNDQLYQDLIPMKESGKLKHLEVIGNAAAPHIIARSVYAGHLAARNFDKELGDETPYKKERLVEWK